MFFKKKQIDENYAAAERKVEKKPVELTDDIKERYRKSGYEYERLSPEEIWLLFSEKENWQPEYDHETQESGNDKFIKLINSLKVKKYKYIIFPDLNFSEIKLSNHWFEHCIFLCSIEKYGDEDSFWSEECKFYNKIYIDSDSARLNFKKCLLMYGFECKKAKKIHFSYCAFDKYRVHEINADEIDVYRCNFNILMTRFVANNASVCVSKFNHLKINSSVVELSEVKGKDVEIYSEKTKIENSQFNSLGIFKTENHFCKKSEKICIISIGKDAVKGSGFRLDTDVGTTACLSDCKDSIKQDRLYIPRNRILISYYNDESIIIEGMICTDIYASELKVSSYFFVVSDVDNDIYLNNFHLISSSQGTVNIKANKDVSICNLSGKNFRLRAPKISLRNTNIEDLFISTDRKDNSVKLNESTFGNVDLENGKIDITQCNIETLLLKGSNFIHIKDSIVNMIYSFLKLERYFYVNNSKIKKMILHKFLHVDIYKTKLDKLVIKSVGNNGGIFINASEIKEDSEISSDSNCQIENSVFENELYIDLKSGYSDKSVLLKSNYFSALDISNCRTNGAIYLDLNIIKGKFSLRNAHARRIEILNTTIHKDCYLSHIDTDGILLLENCKIYGIVDLSFSCIPYVAFCGTQIRTLNMDSLFYKEIKVFDAAWFDQDCNTQEMSDDNFSTKESLRIFKQLPHVVTEEIESSKSQDEDISPNNDNP